MCTDHITLYPCAHHRHIETEPCPNISFPSSYSSSKPTSNDEVKGKAKETDQSNDIGLGIGGFAGLGIDLGPVSKICYDKLFVEHFSPYKCRECREREGDRRRWLGDGKGKGRGKALGDGKRERGGGEEEEVKEMGAKEWKEGEEWNVYWKGGEGGSGRRDEGERKGKGRRGERERRDRSERKSAVLNAWGWVEEREEEYTREW